MYFDGTSEIVPGIMPCTSFTHAPASEAVATIIWTTLPTPLPLWTNQRDPLGGTDANRQAEISLEKLRGTIIDVCVDGEKRRPNYIYTMDGTGSKVTGQAWYSKVTFN